jgi:hypothetical protein
VLRQGLRQPGRCRAAHPVQSKPNASVAHNLCDAVRGSIVIDQNHLTACGLNLRDGSVRRTRFDDPISTCLSEGNHGTTNA